MVESLLTETSGLDPLPCGKTNTKPGVMILRRQSPEDYYRFKPSLVHRVRFRLAIAGEAMPKIPNKSIGKWMNAYETWSSSLNLYSSPGRVHTCCSDFHLLLFRCSDTKHSH